MTIMEASAVSQNMLALQRANELRIAKSLIKRELAVLPPRDGLRRAAALIDDYFEGMTAEDAAIGAFKLDELLLAVRQVGPRKMWRILTVAGIVRSDRRVRDITARQYRALVAAIEGAA